MKTPKQVEAIKKEQAAWEALTAEQQMDNLMKQSRWGRRKRSTKLSKKAK
jgi:hypothetical protein